MVWASSREGPHSSLRAGLDSEPISGGCLLCPWGVRDLAPLHVPELGGESEHTLGAQGTSGTAERHAAWPAPTWGRRPERGRGQSGQGGPRAAAASGHSQHLSTHLPLWLESEGSPPLGFLPARAPMAPSIVVTSTARSSCSGRRRLCPPQSLCRGVEGGAPALGGSHVGGREARAACHSGPSPAPGHLGAWPGPASGQEQCPPSARPSVQLWKPSPCCQGLSHLAGASVAFPWLLSARG